MVQTHLVIVPNGLRGLRKFISSIRYIVASEKFASRLHPEVQLYGLCVSIKAVGEPGLTLAAAMQQANCEKGMCEICGKVYSFFQGRGDRLPEPYQDQAKN